MIVCTVHEPPDAPVDSLDRAEALLFVRDGFSFVATLMAPVWLLSSQLWEAVGAYVGYVVVLGLLVWLFGLDIRWALLLILAAHVLIGFEHASIQRWTLERRGWHMHGTTSGKTMDECERRFFDTWLHDQPSFAPELLGTAAMAFASGSDSAEGLGARVNNAWREFRPLSWWR